VAVGYLGLAVVLTWPLVLHLHDGLPGLLTIDQADTAWLRLASARMLVEPWSWPHSTEIFAPAGYPLGHLVPNWVDHLLGAPLALLLPWPLSDDLWWLGVLAANGLAGHVLGWTVGGDHRAGLLCGVALALCEPVLREANVGHAPQAMVFWAPLFLAALHRALGPEGRTWQTVAAGVLFGLTAATYWYLGLFVGVVGLALAAARVGEGRWRRLGVAAGVAAVVVALPLALTLASLEHLPHAGLATLPDPPPGGASAAVPAPHRWTFAWGSDPLWPLRSVPVDRSNRLSLVLVLAAILGSRVTPGRLRWALWGAAVLAGSMVLGPYLKWGEEPVLVGGALVPLPWKPTAEHIPYLGRLFWPQRWGIAVVLALLPLAARVRRAHLLAVALVVECLACSSNAPLQLTTVAQYDGWRPLAAADGVVLVLPLDRTGPRAPLVHLGYRAARRPLVAPVHIPPGAPEPEAYRAWELGSPFVRWFLDRALDGAPLPAGAVDELVDDGVSVVVLDLTPGSGARPHEMARLRSILEHALGAPEDYGSVLAWWIDPPPQVPLGLADGEAWRERHRERLHDPAPTPRVLMTPVRTTPLGPRSPR